MARGFKMSEHKSEKSIVGLPPWMIEELQKREQKESFQQGLPLYLPLFPVLQPLDIVEENPSQEYDIVDYIIRNDIVGDI